MNDNPYHRGGPVSFQAAGDKFLPRLAAFSFFHYVQYGRGCCMIRVPEGFGHGMDLDSMVEYCPSTIRDLDTPLMPHEAADFVNVYDPRRAVVLTIMEHSGKVLAGSLQEETLGTSPVQAFRLCSRSCGYGSLIPGEVVYLPEQVNDIEPGHYVFLERTTPGPFMSLCAAKMDNEGGVDVTDRTVALHIDFEEVLELDIGVIIDQVWRRFDIPHIS